MPVSSGPKLSNYRRRQSEAADAANRNILEEAHSDRGRVLFSSSFRRLAQKTQVFALAQDGARTRLTHSLEVAHIGNYITGELFKKLDTYKSEDLDPDTNGWRRLKWAERSAIRTFVEVACLVHDIGNPPFGHFGEKAICAWFNNGKGKSWLDKLDSNLRYDFSHFDGNKQGFRILTRLQRNNGDAYSLNLTASQLASTIKYPQFNSDKPSKCSYFESERPIKEELWKQLDLNDAERYPLSLLMEASDDIAYCVSDLEDAAEKGLVTLEDLREAFPRYKDEETLTVGITKARTNFTNHMVAEVVKLFMTRIKDEKTKELSPLFKKNKGLEKLRTVTSRKVYSSKIVLSNEITGFKVIHGLLDEFESLLKLEKLHFLKLAKAFKERKSIYTDELKSTLSDCTREPSLLSLLPKKHLAVYLEDVESNGKNEMFLRMHLLVDFVAGMTDDFALDTYRLLSGQTTYGNR